MGGESPAKRGSPRPDTQEHPLPCSSPPSAGAQPSPSRPQLERPWMRSPWPLPCRGCRAPELGPGHFLRLGQVGVALCRLVMPSGFSPRPSSPPAFVPQPSDTTALFPCQAPPRGPPGVCRQRAGPLTERVMFLGTCIPPLHSPPHTEAHQMWGGTPPPPDPATPTPGRGG